MVRDVLVLLAISASIAHANATDPDVDDRKREPADTASPVKQRGQAPTNLADAPGPLDSDGIAVRGDQLSPWRWVPRIALAPPALLLTTLAMPFHVGFWLNERYHLSSRARELFFTDDRRFGAYPIAYVDSDFGFSIGARAVAKDVFGDGERVRGSLRFGGRFRQRYKLSMASGERFGERFVLRLEGEWERKPRERFFGYGNVDESAVLPMAPVDPTRRELAVATRYRETRRAARLSGTLGLVGPLSAKVANTLERRTFGEAHSLRDDAQLSSIYDRMATPGFTDTIDSMYSDVAIRLDTRRHATRYVSSAMPGAGWLVRSHAGYNSLFDADIAGYVQYGGDAQLFVDLSRGSKVLGLRVLAEQAHERVDRIPFSLLPSLGGQSLLRGYASERFRDRAVTLASVEYMWQVAPTLAAAYLFADVGRTQTSLAALEFDDPRVGFGMGLQMHTVDSFIMRVHVASSIDGGVVFQFALDPTTITEVREEAAE